MTTVAEKTAAVPASTEKSGTTIPDKRRALGRGLDSLLPSGPRVITGSAPPPSATAPVSTTIPEMHAQAARPAGESVMQIPLDAIAENPYQTRYFNKIDRAEADQSGLAELAESIRTNGVIQPITVRPGKDGHYVLIAGERRCRASRIAGKQKIPAMVREVSEQQAAEMTVVENLQREDLNCMDQARAFLLLSQRFQLTQEQIGLRVGVSRETVANYMRMVKLPEVVQRYLDSDQLSFSHARVLLRLVDLSRASYLAAQAVERDLTVHQLEALVEQMNAPLSPVAESGPPDTMDPNVRAAQAELERLLGVRVRIRDNKGKGKIVIEYGSLEDFDRVVEMLKGK